MSRRVGFVNSQKFTRVVSRLRKFFQKKGFLEAHTQSRLSILAACEDPQTISTYNYAGKVWPLPQTGQMWLEHELLRKPEAEGFFSLSTSYRNEPDPTPGRHDLIFPMFEFEMKGGIDEMQKMENELMNYLGFGNTVSEGEEDTSFPEGDYLDIAKKYGVVELEHEHEAKLGKEYGDVFFLKNFPNYSSPFWNMAQNGDGKTARKIDVLVNGVETIGSAERSCDPDEMRRQFHTISDGMYRDILYSKFTKERVDAELDEFLSYNFFPRSGGGIGMTRLIKAMDDNGMLDDGEDDANDFGNVVNNLTISS